MVISNIFNEYKRIIINGKELSLRYKKGNNHNYKKKIELNCIQTLNLSQLRNNNLKIILFERYEYIKNIDKQHMLSIKYRKYKYLMNI